MRLFSRSVALFASLALPLAVSSTAFADSTCDAVVGNLVANCGFETGDFTGWNLVDTTNNSYVDNHNSMSGTYAATLGPEPGTLSQTLTDVAGTLYNFTFEMMNEIATDPSGTPYPGPDAMEVSLIDANSNAMTLLGSQSIPQTSTYGLYSFSFVGTGSDTIVFSMNNVPSYYDLDDVAAVNAPAPEPSSLALMGTGAVFFAEITRRRVKRA